MPYASYLYAATALILVIEIIAGRHRGIYDRSTWFVTLGCLVGAAISRPLSAALIATVTALLLPAYQGGLSGIALLPAFLGVFTLTEFAFYWAHRWSHESKGKRHEWFWKLHRTHHSGKFMNVGVTIRVNSFWAFVVPTPWVLGIATYLGLGQAAGLTILVIYGWNLITHAHFRWDDPIRRHRIFGKPFRALEHLLVSPGMHHSHHGYGKDGGNFRNYAVTLSALDWMFGTLHIPEGRPWKYGVPGPNAHWAEEAFYPIVGRGTRTDAPKFRKNSTSENRTTM
ncbi:MULTISPECIES: sterol desaturase family protein [unclassified Sphingobium]|uniref:sterol desaturase family protein n=1 Tax=unclassified Sphingobium TaxID=2611147 RepID=UPI00119B0B9F|nr:MULTISPECIES: sterol desaturase family protein [unclassified Sphingobium]MBG6116409.1 sterol desaturase/sphingolipid hydroxylase (fatty acid hydroxylase superfamily) [Sphingobium sp. JAI105]TWC95692.1 sterol desaturase/sphingolipid hydroxylase (fatty acid hydroxylase superfamily) [Sphingobium sp. AEW010]TWD15095.1 sterol desaturase/sphingolipid hydroxylase (fatty acid hydroxylase superfamily) [Sphingobium sp. AEW013]TWD18996.1 sterol desaturase/sphingolipid hydroxylase (fatty acid hydroxylas